MTYHRDLRPGQSAEVLRLARRGGADIPPSIRASALVFRDPVSLELQRRLLQFSVSDASVLIVGETGTGKELIARYVHDNSPRARGPFIAVNCAALPETLVEAELFGYEKGAFTGATENRTGWFEAANGGTIFLDEIGDLPLAFQVKLLRVLQEREVTPVGGRKTRSVDVRIVAATNVNLENAVRAGHFREDLFFRLNVARLDVAPLRARRDDILTLSEHFLHVYSEKTGRKDLSLGKEAIKILLHYSWPGNIRELENAIHHAVLVAADNVIRPGDLNLSHVTLDKTNGSDVDTIRQIIHDLIRREGVFSLDGLVHMAIEEAYEFADHNQIKTARLLGLSRSQLRTLMKNHCID